MSIEDYPPQSAENHAAHARAANDLWGNPSRDMTEMGSLNCHLAALVEATLAVHAQLAVLTEHLTNPPRVVTAPGQGIESLSDSVLARLMPEPPTQLADLRLWAESMCTCHHLSSRHLDAGKGLCVAPKCKCMGGTYE